MRTCVVGFLFAIVFSSENLYSQQVVFPLHIGDRWEYSRVLSAYLTGVRISRDTMMPNAQLYSVFECTPPDSSWPYDFRYLRQVGNVVYHYNAALQSEEILYDFDADANDTLLKVPAQGDTVAIIFEGRWTGALFGVQRRHWSFGLYPMHLIDVGESRTITDSLGLTDVTVANGGSTLRGAVINGIKYGDISSALEVPTLPLRIVLLQNYPNPFNPSTSIRFELPKSSTVKLSVYDLLGREVSVLVNERKEAGVHEVKFDAGGLSSGVYLYRLQAGDFVSVKKLLLLR